MTLAMARVADVCEQVRGVSYGGDEAAEAPRAGYLPILRANNITENGLTLVDLVFVPEGRVSIKQRIRRGDVVVATSSGSLSVVGKSASAPQDLEAGFGAFCKVLRPNAAVDPRYFAHFFKTREYRQRVSELAAGANINNLRNEHLDELLFPLPAPAEQRRIAAILDQAEALRTQRRKALGLLDHLRASIFVSMFGSPVRPAFPLGSIRNDVEASSGKSSKGVIATERTAFPIYGGNGINGWATRTLFDLPVLVFGRVGQQCGNAFLTDGPAWVTDNAIVVQIRNMDALHPRFVLDAFSHTDFARRVRHLDLPFINQGMILDTSIVLPPIALQLEYVARMSQVDRLSASHRASLAHLDALFASLQHRAFRGEL